MKYKPLVIAHRINTLEQLREVPKGLGVEIDIRASGKRLVLHHDPFHEGVDFEDYLEEYNHKFLVANIKEAGVELKVIELLAQAQIENYFLLDVEFPFIYRAARQGIRKIAIRFSEDEAIETALNYKEFVDWIWVDTNTKLPIDMSNKNELNQFNTCLVCPERWGRPRDILVYQSKLKELDFKITAVMTELSFVDQWYEY